MKKIIVMMALLAMLFSLALPICADNPIIQTHFTADPAPLVYDGTLYVYVGEDDYGEDGNYNMPHWRCYSTTDMVNWTDHGEILRSDDFEWALPGSAWASQCVERNGKFYFYVTVTTEEYGGGRAIAVAVSDSPTGPFKDALGEPLVGPNWTYIDPTVFIDDDGQAYLYWGNPDFHGVKLKKNMIELDGEIKKFSMTYKAFGQMDKEDGSHDDCYEEGPWVYKRDGIYYLVYAGYGTPESICYSTSDSPMTGWEYKGKIMNNKNSFTIHPGIVEYMGRNYFFYHGGDLEGCSWNLRAVCVAEFEYNEDGTIPLIIQSAKGVEPIAALNPFERVEAETICWSEGLDTEKTELGVVVTDVDNGDYIKLKNVDFTIDTAKLFSVYLMANAPATIDVRLDTMFGELISSLEIKKTSDFKTFSSEVKNVSGVHDVYISFRTESEDALTFDCWQFSNGEEVTLGAEVKNGSDSFNLCLIISIVVIIFLILFAVIVILKKKKAK